MDFKELSKEFKRLLAIVDADAIISIDWSIVQDKKPCVHVDRHYLNVLEKTFGTVAKISQFTDDYYKLSIDADGVEWMCLQERVGGKND